MLALDRLGRFADELEDRWLAQAGRLGLFCSATRCVATPLGGGNCLCLSSAQVAAAAPADTLEEVHLACRLCCISGPDLCEKSD